MVESEDVKKAEIDRLYKENVSKVYRTALYYVEDHYVAEEIVQEVFLKLYDNLGDICMESVPAWLITTAKNMAKNYLRDNLSRTKISRKAHFSRVTEVVECRQMCWNLHRMQHICSRYATKILICIGHFSVEILGNVLFFV